MAVPANPKIYHIVHVDRLRSIIADACIWCDAEALKRQSEGTPIGMSSIKRRRLTELTLTSYPDLHVGACVPFYFCPRSIMLYLLYQGNHPDLGYRDGQGMIVHLEADLLASTRWAARHGMRWAFTLSNAGAYYFEDRSDLRQLGEIDWQAVQSTQWSGAGVAQSVKEGKQAEFLMEQYFPWHLIDRIGVFSKSIRDRVLDTLQVSGHQPTVDVKPDWYY